MVDVPRSACVQDYRQIYPVLNALIGHIGQSSFAPEMLHFAHKQFEADHIHIFRLADGRPQVMASISHDGTDAAQEHAAIYRERQLWRDDQAMFDGSRVASGQPLIFHLDMKSLSASAMRAYRAQMQLRDRTMVIGRGRDGIVGFSMTWSGNVNRHRYDMATEWMAGLAFTILGKHLEIFDGTSRITEILASIPIIEHNLRSILGAVRPREIQVAAHLIYGCHAAHIARDLGISNETVISHRKRLYQRLGVQNSRDLLLWYLAEAPPR